MKEVLIDNEFKLPFNQNLPVVGMISRMAAQKGYDILSQAIPDIMKLDIQFTILGSGQPKYERMMLDAARMYPDKMGVFIGFNNKLAHIIEAGADMFLMPSRFEPCGLNQMYSMRYGTIPVARRTGGIADSVIDVTQKPIVGTGFLFNDYTSDKLYDTIVRAVSAYQDSKKWKKIMLRAMGEDFSWDVSARKYLELYKKIINNRI
jgi:starch synthase